ncbi:MAG: glycosyltransferase family 10 domain-containing protein [Microcystaceae cyanobacterium]
MAKKIVGMLSSYAGLRDQRDWLWKQTPHPFGVWGNIQMMATAEQPDFLLLYQFDFPKAQSRPQQPWWKRWHYKNASSQLDISSLFRGVSQERIIYLLREPPLEEVIPRNQLNYSFANQYWGYVSGPDCFAKHPDYMPAIWYHANSFRELNEMGCPEKNRRCSWVTSGISRTASHRQRLAFLQLLRQNQVEFDLYGRGLPDWAQGYGSVNNKWNAMAPYYYNLSIENYAENEWYISEKMWDSLLAWGLPIYYGGSAADKLLPQGSFLRLPSLDEKGMAYIQEVTANLDAWYAAKEAIAEARQIILHQFNLLAWLSNFVEQAL